MENEIGPNELDQVAEITDTKNNKKVIILLISFSIFVLLVIAFYLLFTKKADDLIVVEKIENVEVKKVVTERPKYDGVLDNKTVRAIIADHEKNVEDSFALYNLNGEQDRLTQDLSDGLITEDEFNKKIAKLVNGEGDDYNNLLNIFTDDGKIAMKENVALAQSFFFYDISQIKTGLYTDTIDAVDNYVQSKEMTDELIEEIKGMFETYKPLGRECDIRIADKYKEAMDKIFDEYKFIYSADLSDCKNVKVIIDITSDIKPIYPYIVAGNSRIRFPNTYEFIPYDLVYESGEWKIDTKVSQKYINFTHNGIEKLENIGGLSQDHYILFQFLEIINELVAYKNDNGYYPKQLSDLFPNYSINIYNNSNQNSMSMKYAINKESKPDRVHISFYEGPPITDQEDLLYKTDSNFNSKDIFSNGFDGSNVDPTSLEDNDSNYFIFDLVSDDFPKIIKYFDDIFANTEQMLLDYENSIR